MQTDGATIREIAAAIEASPYRVGRWLRQTEEAILRLADARFPLPFRTTTSRDWRNYKSDVQLLWGATSLEAAFRSARLGVASEEELVAISVARRRLRPEQIESVERNWMRRRPRKKAMGAARNVPGPYSGT
jgi:hypothetical protein